MRAIWSDTTVEQIVGHIGIMAGKDDYAYSALLMASLSEWKY
jgi:hypothetical protein